jgi:ribosomal protein S18 acetylase RimI-like enzyme
VPATLRVYDRLRDRATGLAVLRDIVARDESFAIHPGEGDWWCFHRDPKAPAPVVFVGNGIRGDGIWVDFEPSDGELTVFGGTADDFAAIVDWVGDAATVVSLVSERNVGRIDALTSRGFTRDRPPWPLFRRTTSNLDDRFAVPAGFEIRPMRGDDEAPARAGAARRAFGTKMDPQVHTARYRAFMSSPGYVPDHDLVAVAPDGRVAAFAIVWTDDVLRIGQFEPVGTDPDFVRRGLGRAVMGAGLARLAAEGMTHARVMTNGENIAAIGLYESCGFEIIDRLHWFHRAAR